MPNNQLIIPLNSYYIARVMNILMPCSQANNWWVYIVTVEFVYKLRIEIGITDVNIHFLKLWGFNFHLKFFKNSISNCQFLCFWFVFIIIFCLFLWFRACIICFQGISGNLLIKFKIEFSNCWFSILNLFSYHPVGLLQLLTRQEQVVTWPLPTHINAVAVVALGWDLGK